MARIIEWAKGVTFFIFVTLLFYFLWENIFSNIIEFVGTDLLNIGTDANTSISIMKTVAWVTYIILYVSTGMGYLLFSFIAGAGNKETHPIEFLKAISVWSIMMLFLIIIYGIMYTLVTALNATNLLDSTGNDLASTFSWILALIAMLALTIFPFIFVMKGYGIDIYGKRSVNV